MVLTPATEYPLPVPALTRFCGTRSTCLQTMRSSRLTTMQRVAHFHTRLKLIKLCSFVLLIIFFKIHFLQFWQKKKLKSYNTTNKTIFIWAGIAESYQKLINVRLYLFTFHNSKKFQYPPTLVLLLNTTTTKESGRSRSIYCFSLSQAVGRVLFWNVAENMH